ncbi:MAG: hypothetical protein AAGF12_16345 [Myxococcota bacterium]
MKRHYMLTVAAGAALALALTGCESDDGEASCGADLAAKVTSVETAAINLAATADRIEADVLAACTSILTDLGEEVPPQGTMTDDEQLRAVCTAAGTAIEAEVTAGATITIAAQPPVCRIDAQAQIQCEASCDVSGGCDPGSIEARCEPGELSVRCEGMCEVDAFCEADANVSVMCEGVCQGRCDGMCMGSSNAAGECDGTCMGMCEGTCRVTADGGVNCGANARCRGGCMGTATAPECRAELMPPMCDIDADCRAGCESQAEFNATCTPGRIAVDVDGGNNAMLATTLENNLPALLAVTDGFSEFVSNSAELADASARVTAEVADIPLCLAQVGGRLAAAVEGAVTAAATVTVSVEVSVSVSGSASAGGA